MHVAISCKKREDNINVCNSDAYYLYFIYANLGVEVKTLSNVIDTTLYFNV